MNIAMYGQTDRAEAKTLPGRRRNHLASERARAARDLCRSVVVVVRSASLVFPRRIPPVAFPPPRFPSRRRVPRGSQGFGVEQIQGIPTNDASPRVSRRFRFVIRARRPASLVIPYLALHQSAVGRRFSVPSAGHRAGPSLCTRLVTLLLPRFPSQLHDLPDLRFGVLRHRQRVGQRRQRPAGVTLFPVVCGAGQEVLHRV
mmetsp:Transcript_3029/g.10629  ORF Transcript_3029/g.10629 Transcript_3029/m.10629 type:complete len:201 (-) Transcript_3029:1319-1921(-)